MGECDREHVLDLSDTGGFAQVRESNGRRDNNDDLTQTQSTQAPPRRTFDNAKRRFQWLTLTLDIRPKQIQSIEGIWQPTHEFQSDQTCPRLPVFAVLDRTCDLTM